MWISTWPSASACRWTPDASAFTGQTLPFCAISSAPPASRCKASRKLDSELGTRVRLCANLETRKIEVSRELHGLTFQHHLELTGAAGLRAECTSAAGLAAREVFWRREVSRPETHHAHAGSAHRVRERALPEHGRVLGARHGDVHDPRGYLHARLRILRGAFGQAGWPAGRG